MFDNDKVTDDLTMQFLKEYPYFFCAGFRIVAAFETHYSKSIEDEQSLRKIYDSLKRLLNDRKIVWTDERGYKVAEND